MLDLVFMFIFVIAVLAFVAYRFPAVKARLARVFGTKTTDKAADVAKKAEDVVDDFFRKK